MPEFSFSRFCDQYDPHEDIIGVLFQTDWNVITGYSFLNLFAPNHQIFSTLYFLLLFEYCIVILYHCNSKSYSPCSHCSYIVYEGFLSVLAVAYIVFACVGKIDPDGYGSLYFKMNQKHSFFATGLLIMSGIKIIFFIFFLSISGSYYLYLKNNGTLSMHRGSRHNLEYSDSSSEDDIPIPSSPKYIKISNVHTNKKLLCTTCFEEFKLKDLVRELPCQHIFHKTCINKWLQNHSSCPLCRSNAETAV